MDNNLKVTGTPTVATPLGSAFHWVGRHNREIPYQPDCPDDSHSGSNAGESTIESTPPCKRSSMRLLAWAQNIRYDGETGCFPVTIFPKSAPRGCFQGTTLGEQVKPVYQWTLDRLAATWASSRDRRHRRNRPVGLCPRYPGHDGQNSECM